MLTGISSEYFELERICEQEEKNTVEDCDSKKLKKKYIGKQLPLPITANIV